MNRNAVELILWPIAPIRIKDDLILNTLARDDVWRHLPGLEKLAAHNYPSTPFNKLGVKVDYCTVPPTFDLFRLEDDTIPDDDARCVARNRRAKQRFIPVKHFCR